MSSYLYDDNTGKAYKIYCETCTWLEPDRIACKKAKYYSVDSYLRRDLEKETAPMKNANNDCDDYYGRKTGTRLVRGI